MTADSLRLGKSFSFEGLNAVIYIKLVFFLNKYITSTKI